MDVFEEIADGVESGELVEISALEEQAIARSKEVKGKPVPERGIIRSKKRKIGAKALFGGFSAAIIIIGLFVLQFAPVSSQKPFVKGAPKTGESIYPQTNAVPTPSPFPGPAPNPAASPVPLRQPAPKGNLAQPTTGLGTLMAPTLPPAAVAPPASVPTPNAATVEPPKTSVPQGFDQTDKTPNESSQNWDKTPDSAYKGESPTDDSMSNNSGSIDVSPADNPVLVLE